MMSPFKDHTQIGLPIDQSEMSNSFMDLCSRFAIATSGHLSHFLEMLDRHPDQREFFGVSLEELNQMKLRFPLIVNEELNAVGEYYQTTFGVPLVPHQEINTRFSKEIRLEVTDMDLFTESVVGISDTKQEAE